MPAKTPIALQPPKALRPLAKMLSQRGFTLAIPFDDIREPGYIGTFQDGQEIIVDDGACLKKYVTLKPKSVALGNTKRASKFSIKGFLKIFGGLLGVDFDFQRAKNVSIQFPKTFVPSKYITTLDIMEDLSKLSPLCKEALLNPRNFLIVQTLQTDSIKYAVDTKTILSAGAKLQIDEAVAEAATIAGFQAKVKYEASRQYSIVVKGKLMTVAYKRYRIPVPLVG